MTYRNNDFLSLYGCCFPVKGFKRSVIFDSQQRNYYEIPNSLFELIELSTSHNLPSLYAIFPENEHDILTEYIDFLLDNNIAFVCEEWEKECYPPMSLEWDAPYSICNAIIECNLFDKVFFIKILEQLEKLFCINLLIHSRSSFCLKEIDEIMMILNVSKIKAIEFYIPYNKELFKIDWESVFAKYPRLFRVVVYEAPQNSYKVVNKISGRIISFVQQIVSSSNCGQIHKGYFTLSQTFFCESQQFNTCLNRKICIDAEGSIKNCPSLQQNFGNIKDTTLEEALQKGGFKNLWEISKDKIDVCKDCEYRYFCSDCRCFIKDPENIYSQPAKCTYNPYICKWQGENGYIPVEECGSYTQATGFVPDKEKIEKLNEVIWGGNNE